MNDCDHDFRLAASESTFGSHVYDIDVTVCRKCGAVRRSLKEDSYADAGVPTETTEEVAHG